jgi:hypothetical protein
MAGADVFQPNARKFYTANEYPGIDVIKQNFAVLNGFLEKRDTDHPIVTLKWLKQLGQDVSDLKSWYIRMNGLWGRMDSGIYGGPQPFASDLNQIEEAVKVLVPNYYQDLVMTEGDMVNGYKIPRNTKSPIFYYDDFMLYRHLWKPSHLTFEEFYEIYDRIACSEWSKADTNGECYGGYWNYPVGSNEKENAWELTRQDNGRALWNLPYPKIIVLVMIRVGCSMRMDSVPEVNFLCEWLRRKSVQMLEPKYGQIQRWWKRRFFRKVQAVNIISRWWKSIYYRLHSRYYNHIYNTWIGQDGFRKTPENHGN